MIGTDLMEAVVQFMNTAETLGRLHKMNGAEKKQYVLDQIELRVGPDDFKRYELVLGLVIDGLVSITRKDLMLALKHTKSTLLSCCS